MNAKTFGEVAEGGASPVAVIDRKSAIRSAMLSGPILGTMVRLALPTTGVQIAQTVVGVAETFYVGFLGTDALVGVALVFPIWMLMMMSSGGGIGSGVGSAISRAIGSGRNKDADALVLHAVILAIVFGLLFSAGSLAFGPKLYHALGGTGEALQAATLYSNSMFAAAVPLWIVNLLSSALRGAGNVRVPAKVTLLGAAILIPLSPLFIFGVGPIPGFGVAGAGIAVTIYYTLAAVILLRYLRQGRSGLVLKSGPARARLFRDILKVGMIAALSAMQVNLTVIFVTGAVGRFGPDALAGYGMASRLDYLMTPFVLGLGTAVLTMIGINVGAGNMPRVRRIAWIGLIAGGGLTEVLGLLAALFPAVWIGLFSRDPNVLAPGALYLGIVAPFYGALGINVVANLSSQGGGRPIWPFLAGTARLLVSAGLGWFAVVELGAGMQVLFGIIAAGAVASALICVTATSVGATWRAGRE